MGWRRHVPPAVPAGHRRDAVAAARPFAVISLPTTQETIILAMDVSGSMRATDVKPSRLVAPQNAAKAFLGRTARNIKVGIVAFAGSAQVVQPPTLSREDLVAAIDKFQMQRATAIGSAIVVSLAELFPDQGIDLSAMQYGNQRQQPRAIDQAPGKARKEFQPGGAGLLHGLGGDHPAHRRPAHGRRGHDGGGQDGGRPRRARLHVGVGTVEGETIGFEGWSMRVAGRAHAQGGGQRHPGRVLLRRRHRRVAEEDLREAELAPDGGEEGDRDSGLVALVARPWRCCRPGCRCSGSTGSCDSLRRPCSGQPRTVRRLVPDHRAGHHCFGLGQVAREERQPWRREGRREQLARRTVSQPAPRSCTPSYLRTIANSKRVPPSPAKRAGSTFSIVTTEPVDRRTPARTAPPARPAACRHGRSAPAGPSAGRRAGRRATRVSRPAADQKRSWSSSRPSWVQASWGWFMPGPPACSRRRTPHAQTLVQQLFALDLDRAGCSRPAGPGPSSRPALLRIISSSPAGSCGPGRRRPHPG